MRSQEALTRSPSVRVCSRHVSILFNNIDSGGADSSDDSNMAIGRVGEDNQIPRLRAVSDGHPCRMAATHVHCIVIPNGSDAVLDGKVALSEFDTLILVPIRAIAIAAVT